MLNKSNYFITDSSPIITASVVADGVNRQVTYSSVGKDFKNIFKNNADTLKNLITAINGSAAGVYFANSNEHIRKDTHYGN